MKVNLALLLVVALKIVVVDSSHNPVVGARVSVKTSDGRLVPPAALAAYPLARKARKRVPAK
jgi:hypothetical protein